MVLLLTEWPECSALTPDGFGGLVARRILVDARNVLDRGAWRDYRALGEADLP